VAVLVPSANTRYRLSTCLSNGCSLAYLRPRKHMLGDITASTRRYSHYKIGFSMPTMCAVAIWTARTGRGRFRSRNTGWRRRRPARISGRA